MQIVVTGVSVMASLALMCSDAAGQSPRYRLTPLVKIDFTPQADLHGTLGINNLGHVVYGYHAGEGVLHAWLWLPTGDYGLAAGFHDLTTLSESDEPASCTVNSNDLLAIIAAYGPCGGSFAGPGSPPTLEETIAMVLASDLGEDLKAQIIEELIADWPD